MFMSLSSTAFFCVIFPVFQYVELMIYMLNHIGLSV